MEFRNESDQLVVLSLRHVITEFAAKWRFTHDMFSSYHSQPPNGKAEAAIKEKEKLINFQFGRKWREIYKFLKSDNNPLTLINRMARCL